MSRLHTLSRPRREQEGAGSLLAWFWSFVAGLLVPMLIVLVGLIAMLLNRGGLTETSLRLGRFLWLPIPESFLAQSPLTQLSELVMLGFFSAVVFSVAVWVNRLDSDGRARRIVNSLQSRMLKQSLRRAELEGAASQRFRAEQLIGRQLPELQECLSLWYRNIPRNILTLIGCVFLALLVNVWLALMAVISGILLWQLYRALHPEDDDSVLNWEVPRTRSRMAELVGQAPLLARLQTQGLTDRAFQSELDSLDRRLCEIDAKDARVWPILFMAIAAAVSVMLLGLGVNLLDTDRGLSLPAALILGLSLGAAAVAMGRLMELGLALNRTADSSDAIYNYLESSGEIAASEQRVGLSGIRDKVEMQGVSLGAAIGRPILKDLSLQLIPGSLIALLGTESVSTRALTELLMGFGVPSGGQVTIDGIPLRDIHPKALARNVMWVQPSGLFWDGTIQENLCGSDSPFDVRDVVEALQEVGVYEQIQRLADGINTMFHPEDSALSEETTYAMSVARAVLHKPPIVLAMEPPPPAQHLPEDPCLVAFEKLAASGSIVIVLPRRLPTLRRADRVVLLNGPRLVGEGKHSDLLANSDLYRHLNYLLFNPYRHHKGEPSS